MAPGEFVGIMGPSGSGKTTLLNCVATIDTVTSGHILVDGRDITGLRSRALAKFRRDDLGFIFQDSNLLDTLTGFENIALALTTIMMVTHDSFAASFASRILFIKDGAVFNEIRRGATSRGDFFNRIMEVVTFLGGDVRDAG